VLFVTDDTHGSHTFDAEATNFARWHTHLGVVTFLGQQLGLGSSAADGLAAFSWLELNVVNERTSWDKAERHAVAGFNSHVWTAGDGLSNAHLVVGNHVMV
jgi:hypothetical protein